MPRMTLNLLFSSISQLGVQFDGYCSTVATTIVVGAKGPVTGPKADVIKAAETALEATLRMIRPGNKVNFDSY